MSHLWPCLLPSPIFPFILFSAHAFRSISYCLGSSQRVEARPCAAVLQRWPSSAGIHPYSIALMSPTAAPITYFQKAFCKLYVCGACLHAIRYFWRISTCSVTYFHGSHGIIKMLELSLGFLMKRQFSLHTFNELNLDLIYFSCLLLKVIASSLSVKIFLSVYADLWFPHLHDAVLQKKRWHFNHSLSSTVSNYHFPDFHIID